MPKIWVTRHEQIDIQDINIEGIFNERLKHLCGGEHVFINEKGLVSDWEDTGHGSGIISRVESVTPVMLAAIKLRDALNKERHEALIEKDKEQKRRTKKTKG